MDGLSNSELPELAFESELYTLKEFFASVNRGDRRLPTIVRIVSLNNYGRSIKNILPRHMSLVLLETAPLESVIADYYGSYDGRNHTQRSRLPLPHSRMVSRSTAKLRNMKHMSKSVANLSAANVADRPGDNDFLDNDEDDENTYNLRSFIKLLNEKRSSSVFLCRIPAQYESFFELLNADGRTIEPYSKLADLPQHESDRTGAERGTERTPVAILLRSSCNAYTKKEMIERVRPATNDQRVNLAASVDSCYDSSSDLDLQKSSLVLNEIPEVLAAGQTLVVLGDCYAHRTQWLGTDRETSRPSTPASPHFSPVSWMRSMSKLFSSKEHRHSSSADRSPGEGITRKAAFETFEHYVKCRTERDDIVYVYIDEPVLFSLLNRETQNSRLKSPLNYIDTSDVFQVKDLLSNFRFPITVRLLDGPLAFDNPFAPAVINREDGSRLAPTKFRLLGSHTERVVFACPLNKGTLKAARASLPLTVLSLSVTGDIGIQACSNMNAIVRSDTFRRIVNACSEIIKQHQTEITQVHFPLSLTKDINQGMQALYKKRSQSESFADYFDEGFGEQLPHSAPPPRDRRHSDEISFLTARSLHNEESDETVQQKLSLDTVKEQPVRRRSGQHVKFKDDQKNRSSRNMECAEEDEIYKDVDKIYDYIRTGNTTDDMKKIFAKEQQYEVPQASRSIPKRSDRNSPVISGSSGKMITRHCSPQPTEPTPQFLPCDDDDGNVNNEQAHALYLAAKQHHKGNSQQDLSNTHVVTKAKRITKR